MTSLVVDLPIDGPSFPSRRYRIQSRINASLKPIYDEWPALNSTHAQECPARASSFPRGRGQADWPPQDTPAGHSRVGASFPPPIKQPSSRPKRTPARPGRHSIPSVHGRGSSVNLTMAHVHENTVAACGHPAARRLPTAPSLPFTPITSLRTASPQIPREGTGLWHGRPVPQRLVP